MTVGDLTDPHQTPQSQPQPQPPAQSPVSDPPPAPAPVPPVPPVQTDQELIENFPVAKLNKLDELISNPRWVIPVLPGGELEVLLEYSRELSKRKVGREGRYIFFITNIM